MESVKSIETIELMESIKTLETIESIKAMETIETMKSMQDILSFLFEKYKNMPYMLNRLQHHVITTLPLTLENDLTNLEKRIERTIQITNEQETFIHLFLSKHALFYLTSNNGFYIYDGVHYVSMIEDELNHLILSTITKTGGELLNQCKYKTKMAIIKQIKSRPLWKSIPETETIQDILSFLHPTYFKTKEEAKYFLTILGDNLLKKYSEEEGLYLLAISDKTKLKKMFIEMDMLVFYASGVNNLSNTIVTKYHPSYNYDNCRILHFNDSFDTSLMKPFIIDFLCVSAYHSERYQNSENYILTSGNDFFLETTLYMKNKNEKLVLNEFCKECIIVDINDSSISWKNLHYIWKMFLTTKSIPNLIYSNVLKEMLKEKFVYNEQNDTFENITSKWLPNIRTFLAFWEDTIQVDYSTELEVEEIAILFKMYTNNNQNLQEEEILKILNHYFNSIEIFNSKYIPHIACKLWDKNNEIALVLNAFKDNFNKKKFKETFITFENVYSFYTKQKPMSKIHISKRYFEKYMDENLEQHIVIEKCIHKDWICSE